MIKRVLLLSVLLAACGPLGPLPGGALDGELAASPPTDWSFSDAHTTIQLEVRLADPYSVNLWCTATGGRLYVGSGGGASSVWAAALLEDGRAHIRIDGVLYPVVATHVTNDPEIQEFLDALETKYDRSDADIEDFHAQDGEPPEGVLFRLASPAQ